jgi:hypothetical protein
MRRLSVVRLIRSWYLLYLAQPAADRALYRAIQRQPIRAIVEIGVGLGEAAGRRTERILEIAGWRRDCLPLSYTGIDLFESRPDHSPRLALKEAFGALRATVLRASGAKTRLVPGDPYSALARTANALTNTDLVVISADVDRDSLAQAWRFMPRMIHPRTLILLQESSGATVGKAAWRQLKHEEVLKLAADANRAVRRAA